MYKISAQAAAFRRSRGTIARRIAEPVAADGVGRWCVEYDGLEDRHALIRLTAVKLGTLSHRFPRRDARRLWMANWIERSHTTPVLVGIATTVARAAGAAPATVLRARRAVERAVAKAVVQW